MVDAVTPEQMEIYRQTARARQRALEAEAERRREAAWVAAREAARVLKEQFGAQRVIVFGSLAHGAWFHPTSDIDLAAEGIAPADFFRAWGAIERPGNGIEVDLVALEDAPPWLRSEIEKGVTL